LFRKQELKTDYYLYTHPIILTKVVVMASPVLKPVSLIEFIKDSLQAGGFSVSNSEIVSNHLVDAEMKGVPSHGVNRLGLYLSEVQRDIIDPQAEPVIKKIKDSLLSVNGSRGIGIVAMKKATDAAIDLANTNGIAAAGITQCGHTGRMGAYAEQAANAGFLAISFGGGGRKLWGNVVPFGGKESVMSTNPYTLGMPGLADDPVVCDFAISNWPAGKVAVARANGDQLPDNIIIDKDGKSSTDPEDFYNGGALLPAAGAKGSGLGIIAELMGDAMLGEAIEYNWLFLLIRADAFRPMSAYAASAKEFIHEVRGSKPLDPEGKVILPGERETSFAQQAKEEGITISDGVWDSIKTVAEEYGVKANNYF
jgi:LDH2 family malate/lactate/ureidoglycolate dehydrogenase